MRSALHGRDPERVVQNVSQVIAVDLLIYLHGASVVCTSTSMRSPHLQVLTDGQCNELVEHKCVVIPVRFITDSAAPAIATRHSPGPGAYVSFGQLLAIHMQGNVIPAATRGPTDARNQAIRARLRARVITREASRSGPKGLHHAGSRARALATTRRFRSPCIATSSLHSRTVSVQFL